MRRNLISASFYSRVTVRETRYPGIFTAEQNAEGRWVVSNANATWRGIFDLLGFIPEALRVVVEWLGETTFFCFALIEGSRF